MYVNDLNEKVKERFYKEITVEDEGDDISYVFPDTSEFIKIIKRKMIRDKFLTIEDED
ncbi:MAG: hypothetical protein P8Y70_05695 [Candidatus Lokiarchaeota archaeon]